MTITTTLKAIRKCGPCGLRPETDGSLSGYAKLKAFLGDGFADDAPVKFSMIAKSNGMDDALWCLRSLGEEHLPAIISFVADCAESVLYIWEDWAKDNAPEHLNVPRLAIEAARNGDAAADAARAAARAADAADAAADAARAARAADAADAAAYAAYAMERKIELKLLKKHFS